MREDLNYSEFIERYLHGEMSPEEVIWFEKEIEGNIHLRDEIKLRQQINLVLSDKDVLELHEQLDKIHMEIMQVSEKGKLTIRRAYGRIYSAAGALALVVLGLMLFLQHRNFSNQKLIDEFYSPAVASANFRSAGEMHDKLVTAMSYYKEGEYAKAIALFEYILKNDSTKIGINLYSGISHMEIKEYNTANERFQRIIQNEPNPFVESAKWYLGMCYVLTDNRKKAVEQFKSLADANGFYRNDAKRILRRIN
ncbi:MAG: tetratricopeptide repeat protein [Bacteroidales bacterium]|nr:tetratricopeptide repeat protein [Bacteroidales bacterium]